VAQDTVLWYNLCEYVNERVRISSLAEQPQTSKQRRCPMQFIKVPFHFVLCTLLSVPSELWVMGCTGIGEGLPVGQKSTGTELF